MNIPKAKYLIAISAGILVVVSTVALTKSSRATRPPIKEHQEKKQSFDTLPLIISEVKDIEVVKATLKHKGKPTAFAVLEIKNNSDKAIIAISIETGEPKEANGIALEGFRDDDEPPPVVIEPHRSITVEFLLSNVKLGDPIRVSGVLYADDSADGEKTAVETIHSLRKGRKSKPDKPEGDSSPK